MKILNKLTSALVGLFASACIAGATGTIQFTSSSSSGNEGSNTSTINVLRTGGTPGTATSVTYTITAGTASVGTTGQPVDATATALSGTLNWSTSEIDNVNKTLPPIALRSDGVPEGSEAFTIVLTDPTNGATLGTSTHTVSIASQADDTLAVTSSTFLVGENGGNAMVLVSRSAPGGNAHEVSVNYSVSNGSATAGEDYTTASGTLNWASGDTATKTITVPILQDTRRESSETFTVSLSAPGGLAGLGTSLSTVTILDDDGSTPSITSTSGAGAYVFGNTITLSATFTGSSTDTSPAPTYVWTRDGVTIADGARYSQTVSSPATANTSTATLVISDAKTGDEGTYTFTVTNQSGLDQESIGVTFSQTNTSRDPATAALSAGSAPRAFVTLPDGRTLVAVSNTVSGASGTTSSNTGLVVVGLDGRVSSSGAGVFTGNINALHLLDDGKVLVLGSFTQIGGVGGAGRVHLARLNANLTLDTTFVPFPVPSFDAVNVSGNSVTNIDQLTTDAAGRILVGGRFANYGGLSGYDNLVRLYADGALDTSFTRAPDGEVNVLLRQSNGKVVVAGGFNTLLGDGLVVNSLYRLNLDGSVDESFTPPLLSSSVSYSAGALDDSSNIVLARNLGLVRLLPDGLLDPSFSFNGGVNKSINAVLPVLNGKLIVAGNFENASVTPAGGGAAVVTSFGRIFRLNSDGSYDTTYNAVLEPTNADVALNGEVTVGYIAPTGRVWLAGSFTSGDADWLGSGTNTATRILVLQGDAPSISFTTKPNGEVFVDGEALQLSTSATGLNGVTYAWRRNGDLVSNGGGVSGATSATLSITSAGASNAGEYTVTITNGFGDSVTSPVAVLQRIGVPVVISSPSATTSDLGTNVTLSAVVEGSGSLTFQWLKNGVAVVNGATGQGSTISGATTISLTINNLALDDGGFYTLRTTYSGGTVSSTPALLTVQRRPGALATSVASVAIPSLTVNDDVFAVLRLSDGSMLIGGRFTQVVSGGTTYTRTRIARFLSSGAIDMTFNPSFNGDVNALAQDSSGRIFVGGNFTSVTFGTTTTNRTRVARLTSGLALDTDFNTATAGPTGAVKALAPTGTGSVYVGGSFNTITGVTSGANRIALLNASGGVDNSFTSAASGDVNAIVRLSSGELILGGASGMWPSGGSSSLVRLSSTGSRLSFATSPSGIAINSLNLMADGTLLVAGGSGSSTNYLTRLNATTGAESVPALIITGFVGQAHSVFSSGTSVLASINGAFFRSNTAGVLDSGFDSFNSAVNAIAVDDSGRVWVGGRFTQYAGAPAVGLVVLAGGDLVNGAGNLAAQTISFSAIPGRVFAPGTTVELDATASSGEAVTYSVSGPATLASNVLTITSAGTISVTATQAGSPTLQATSLSRTFTVTKATQSINAPESIPDRLVADGNLDLAPLFSATSGLDVSFALELENPGSAELQPDGSTIAFTGPGRVTVIATQSGNSNFAPAPKPDVSRSFNVSTTGSTVQTITFAAFTPQVFGVAPITLRATSNSRLPVSFSIVSGGDFGSITNGVLTITGAGSIVIRASQSGNGTFAPAADVDRTMVINKASQTITFTPPAKRSLSDGLSLALTATSNRGDLPMTFALVGSNNPATLEDNVLSLTGAGKVTVIASQAGTDNFLPASSKARTITITAPQLTLSALSAVYDGEPHEVVVSGAPEGLADEVVVNYVGTNGTSYPRSETAPTLPGDYRVIASLGTLTRSGTLRIAKRPLLVTALPQTRLVGTSFAGVTFPVEYSAIEGNANSGFVSGEDADDLTTAPFGRANATATSVAGGTFFITPTGGVDESYSFVYRRAALTLVGLGGGYEAILEDSNSRPVGLLRLNLPNNGFAYTGTLVLAGESNPIVLKSGSPASLNPSLVGVLDEVEATIEASGTFTRSAVNATAKAPRLPLLQLELEVNTSGNVSGILLSDSSPVAELADGRKLVFARPTSNLGASTMVILPPEEIEGVTVASTGIPEAYGHATGSISSGGALRLTGRLPDGTPLTASMPLDVDGHYRLFSKPYSNDRRRNGSYLGGYLVTAAHPTLVNRTRVVPGTLLWNKVGFSGATDAYNGGFGPVTASFYLEPWVAPTVPVRLPMLLGLAETASESGTFDISYVNSLFTSEQTNLLASNNTGTISAANAFVNVSNLASATFTLNAKTGAFTGSVRLPVPPNGAIRSLLISGALIQIPASENEDGVIGAGLFQMNALRTPGDNTTLAPVLSGLVFEQQLE